MSDNHVHVGKEEKAAETGFEKAIKIFERIKAGETLSPEDIKTFDAAKELADKSAKAAETAGQGADHAKAFNALLSEEVNGKTVGVMFDEAKAATEAAIKGRSWGARIITPVATKEGVVIRDLAHAKELGGVWKNAYNSKLAMVAGATALGAYMASSLFSSKTPDVGASQAR